MAYAPPQVLNFDFAAATSGTLSFEFNPVNTTQTIGAAGTDVSTFGTTVAANRAATVAPSGTSFSVYGSPFANIPGANQTTVPVGINAPPFGTAWLGNTIRAEFSVPLPASPYGTALHFQFTLPLAQQQVYPLGYDAARYGTSVVAPSPYVYPVGTDMARYGTTFVANKSDLLQTVYPNGSDASAFGDYYAVGRALRFKFGMDYTVPTPPLEFDFEVMAGTKYITAYGPFLTEFGTPAVENRNKFAYPDGIPPGDPGTPWTYNRLAAAPSGWASSAFGTTFVENFDRVVLPVGIAPGVFGQAEVVEIPLPVTQTVVAASAGLNVLFGEALFDLSIRYLTLLPEQALTAYGTPTVWYYTRTVAPTGIGTPFGWQKFGSATVWDGEREVYPFGFDSSVFGAADARRNEVLVYPPSIVGAVGLPDVQYGTRYVGPREFTGAFAAGTPLVYNSDQYVAPFFSTDDIPYQGGFGTYTWVYNRNRVVGPYGWGSSRYSSGAEVLNNARLVEDRGAEVTLYGTAMVAMRVRYVTPVGTDFFETRPWTVVYNKARAVSVGGIPPGTVGAQYVWSNTQWVDMTNVQNLQTLYGTAMVAPAIRYIDLNRLDTVTEHGIPPGDMGDPTAALWTQYVVPPAIQPPRVGDAIFEMRRYVIYVWAANIGERFGESTARNVTPELRVGSIANDDLQVLPKPTVTFRVRYVDLGGKGIPAWTPLFPPWGTVVSTRTQTVAPPGIFSQQIPNLHEVRGSYVEVIVTQTVFPVGFNYSPFVTKFGHPTLPVWPYLTGWDSSAFGNTWVRVQGCRPLWDWPSSEFGRPSLAPPRTIGSVTLGLMGGFGKPRSTPHTVYCTFDATEQAKNNHPGLRWALVDADRPGGPEPLFGMAEVSQFEDRRIYQYHDSWPYDQAVPPPMGEPSVELKIRTIYPVGTKQERFGYPELPTTKEIMPVGQDSMVFGEAQLELGVAPATTRSFTPAGFYSNEWGATFVENFNRSIYTVGSDTAVFGNNIPMVYHYPRGPKNTGGSDLTIWGTARVEFKIRSIYPVGTDFFTMGYEPMKFNERLRVYKLNHPTFPGGEDFSAFGTTGVRLAAQIVTPYMIPPPRCFGHDISVTHGS